MKYINFKRYKFSTVLKKISTLRYNFLKIFKSIGFKRYDIKKFYKYFDLNKFNFYKIFKYFNLFLNKISNLKKINILRSKFLILHLPLSIIFFGFLYLFIPTFYNYDKASIENIICKDNNIQCIIKGKIKYRFYPTPRLKIKDLVVNEISKKKQTLLNVNDTSIKLSFKNLLAKEQHKFKKIELNNFETKINLRDFKKFKNFFNKTINLIPVIFKNGEIFLYEDNNYLTSITKTKISTKFINGLIDAELNGKFLNDDIHISLNKKKDNNKIFTDFSLKMKNLNFFTKTSFLSLKNQKEILDGTFLIKQNKNKIAGIYDYKDNALVIKKSNLRNTVIDGKLIGKIIFLPYFDFDLDLALNSINFTRLYNYFLTLDEVSQKNLFNINSKINGKLNFSTEKVYSKNNLIDSFESRLKFYNGNVNIDQFLINLGKLGAADILGDINNDKKYTRLKFESNIFIDNKKKFLSKFGIYDKGEISPNLFISGNFDLDNIRASFYEISSKEKFSREDINYIESEFNDLVLEDGFKYLFDFSKFKVFLKSIADEKN